MKFHVITLFPELFESFSKVGLIGQAASRGQITIETVPLRDFAIDDYGSVDDRPYGGGDGMILRPEPLKEALSKTRGKVFYLSPQGKPWDDSMARAFSGESDITLLCGRYGGIDQRVINSFVDEEISIGDYILNGGEVGAMAVIESLSRFIPGVLGNEQSYQVDSFSEGLLEGPSFTRPESFDDQRVPDVFLSGHHEKIEEARRCLSRLKTLLVRPDLLEGRGEDLEEARAFFVSLSGQEKKVLGLPEDINF